VRHSSVRLSVLLLLSLLVAPVARAQNTGSAGDIAQLLALEDRREFDAAVLQRAAQHPDSIVRARAAMAMGRIGDPAALTLLLPMLEDRDSVVRTETAFALGLLGDRDAVSNLAALAARFPATATGSLTIEIVTALARLGGPDAERALGAILDRHPPGDDASDRATAAVLGQAFRLGRRSSLAPRLADYIRNGTGDWKENAAFSASRLGLPSAMPALLDATRDPNPAVRMWAARSLVASLADSAGLGRASFVTALRGLVNDSDDVVRITALRALGSFADSSLVPVAAARLVDRDPNVPIQAAQTLGSLGGSRAAGILAERFPGASTYGLRRAILLALAQVDPAQAIGAARQWRSDPDWRLRATYAEMLSVAATPAATQQLFALASDQDPRVVGLVLNALASVVPEGDTTLLALARANLAAADYIVRAAATDIVGRERNPADIRDLAGAYRRAEADPNDDARLAAVRALADIADVSPAAQGQVEASLLSSFPRSSDYLVRRLVARRFGEATLRRYWGRVGPIETGRTIDEYRELARRYVLGQQPPGPVTIETEHGDIVLQLYAYEAPLTVDNFLRLVDRRFFDNGRWHRVVPGFVAQDGDPRGDGSGGPGTVIRDEINRRRYVQGTLGMALSGPDTGGSQFFITYAPQPHLDGGYTVFGGVVSGWDALVQTVQGDRIRRIFR